MKRSEFFYVRITKAFSENVWYADQIGKVFLVREPYENPWGYEAKKNGASIFTHDCERIAK